MRLLPWIAPAAATVLASLAACAAASAEPAPLTVGAWHACGPFESGTREVMIHPLADWDGRVLLPPDLTATVPSVLVDGGRASWLPVDPERDEAGVPTGKVSFEMPNVAWKVRESEWGAAALSNVAVAWGELDVPQAGVFVLEAAKCTVVIDGVAHAGDPYGAGISQPALALAVGRHGVLVLASGWEGSRAFTFRLLPVAASAPFVRAVENDVLLPDLVQGESGQGFASVPVASTSKEWLGGVVVELSGAVSGRAELELPLAPLGTLAVPVPVTWAAPPAPTEAAPRAPVTVRVTAQGRTHESTREAEIRSPVDARLVTFLSRLDRSAQGFGLRPSVGPRPDDVRHGYGLILSTHGAGVGAEGQARAHAPKDWAYVVAPTNRRPYGFDWHDWGRLDFEEVMDLALETLPIDPERVVVAGHSMGGHGAWLMAVHHADRFSAASPSAGWVGHDSYLPPVLRKSAFFAEPLLAATWLRATQVDRVTPFLENLAGVAVHVLHGAADDNVPPTHARLITGTLSRQGQDVRYEEVAGQGHWWDLDKERPGADCVDSAGLETTWRASRRAASPQHVVLVTGDPDVSLRRHWVEILEADRVAVESRLEAEIVTPDHVVVTSRGVRRFALDLLPPRVTAGRVTVEAGEAACRVVVPPAGATFAFERQDGRLTLLRGDGRAGLPEGSRPGGLRKALFEPFLLVVGTSADDARSEVLLETARAFALAWWVRGRGLAPVVRDVDLTDDLRKRHQLVLFGGPEANAEAARLARGLVIRPVPGGLAVSGHVVRGTGLAAVHWQVDPRAPRRRVLVLQGSDAAGERLLGLANPFGSGIGLPDWMVYGEAVRARGLGGMAGLGWWTPRFAFSPQDSWFAAD